MAGMKFWYVTVLDRCKTVYQRKCLTAKEATELLKEKKEEFKEFPNYSILKEWF